MRILLAALTTMVLWASSFVVIRSAGEHFGPGSMALLRMLVGSAGLGSIALIAGARRPRVRELPLIVVWGVGWFTIYNLALNQAETQLDAGTASMLVNLAPLISVLLGGLFLGEGFPRPLLLGAPLAFLGVVLIGASSWTGDVALTGVLLAVLAAFLYGGSTILQKRLLRHTDATTLTLAGALAGTAALLPWSGELVHDIAHAPASATTGVVYLGLFSTALAFTTWGYVLARSTAGKTATTSYIVPVLVLLMSAVFLGEIPTPNMLAGGALCLLGVLVTRMPIRWFTRRRRARSAAAGERVRACTSNPW
ncbi:DMT family transporter [Brevibacterium salitolerans]|uniref:DMT family transporter n=1 Tax=Brevibacterium salitolerans TaxID=1403566 RepID=A0ABP5IPV0_9MICO